MISQYDKDMCCLYIAEGMNYICNNDENRYLAELRDALLPELMSGNLKIKGATNG